VLTRAQTLAGYAVIAWGVMAYQWRAWRGRGTPTLGAAVTAVCRRVVARWPLRVGWLWLGWHLFTRVHW
jgi:hypothetical protein